MQTGTLRPFVPTVFLGDTFFQFNGQKEGFVQARQEG